MTRSWFRAHFPGSALASSMVEMVFAGPWLGCRAGNEFEVGSSTSGEHDPPTITGVWVWVWCQGSAELIAPSSAELILNFGARKPDIPTPTARTLQQSE